MKKLYSVIIMVLFTGCASQPLTPFGAAPSTSQLAWHNLEYYMFIHFGPNTFTNVEWGHGDEDPNVFNPSQLDCRQWAATASKAGMKGIIITAKHHDGFCLWPSQYSKHTVRESIWKEGKGDLLRELSDACREYGLKFGVYLSPWDRNHPDYGTDRYNQVFVNMLEEVLGNYGEVFEQWFDGANGEGPNGKRQEYDWPLFNSTVYKLQPQAIIFSDGGPGCRWVGNEKGFVGETNWCTLNADKVYPGYPNYQELTSGHEDGSHWVPAECDVSIRPGWFYSPETDNQVKTLNELMDIYYGSIGRGGNLLLNVPVDRRGLIHPNDSVRLMEFKQAIDQSFSTNLAGKSEVRTTSQKRGYAGNQLIDGKPETYWASDDRMAEIELTFDEPVSMNRILLIEGIEYGQRIKSFEVEAWIDKHYQVITNGTTVGNKRILKFDKIETEKIRVRITDSKANPILGEVQLFNADY